MPPAYVQASRLNRQCSRTFLADQYMSSILNLVSVSAVLVSLISSFLKQHTKIGHRLEQLRGQRESDICDICDTNEPVGNRLISLCSSPMFLACSVNLAKTTYFLRMLNRVFSFEPSSPPPLWPSAALGVERVGVEVPDLSKDAALDDVAEETDMLRGRDMIPRAGC